MNVKLFLTALTLCVLYTSAVEEVCTLRRRDLLVVTMSQYKPTAKPRCPTCRALFPAESGNSLRPAKKSAEE